MQFKKHPVLGREISDTGLIRKVRGTGYMSLATGRTGYVIAGINGKTYYLHRLVWETFNGLIPKHLQINHIDGDKTNNKLSNLELVTASQNIRHAHDTGLKSGLCGECNGNAKLSNDDYLDIIQKIVDGKTNAEIALQYGLNDRYISLVRHKRRLKSVWREYEKKNGKVNPLNSSGQSKLNLATQVELISQLPDFTNKVLATKFNVCPTTVSRIRARKAWSNAWRAYLEGSTTSRET